VWQPTQCSRSAPRDCSHPELDAQIAFCNPTKFEKRWVGTAVQGTIPTSIDVWQSSQSSPPTPRDCSHPALDAQIAFRNPTKFEKRWVGTAVQGTAVETSRPKGPRKGSSSLGYLLARSGHITASQSRATNMRRCIPRPYKQENPSLGRTTFERQSGTPDRASRLKTIWALLA
jgi:hypothetical protein